MDDEEEQNNNNFELSFNKDLLGSTLVLEDFVNLQDPIFQDGESRLCEESNISNINNKDINMDFDPINLVDDILNIEMN